MRQATLVQNYPKETASSQIEINVLCNPEPQCRHEPRISSSRAGVKREEEATVFTCCPEKRMEKSSESVRQVRCEMLEMDGNGDEMDAKEAMFTKYVSILQVQ